MEPLSTFSNQRSLSNLCRFKIISSAAIKNQDEVLLCMHSVHYLESGFFPELEDREFVTRERVKNMHKLEVPILEFILSVLMLSTLKQGQGKARKATATAEPCKQEKI